MKESAFRGFGLMKFDDYNYSSLNQMIFKMQKHPNAADTTGKCLSLFLTLSDNVDENGEEKMKDFLD